jgi:hypothetical protein
VASAEQVNVQVIYGLAAVLPGVDDETIAVVQLLLSRNLASQVQQVAEHRSVLRQSMCVRRDVLLRNDQYMHRSLRVDIRERERVLVLTQALGGNGTGDDLAEEAVHKSVNSGK